MKVVLLACFLALAAAAAPVLLHAEDGFPNEYIVVLKANTTVEKRDAIIDNLPGSQLMHRYKIGQFIGFAAKLKDVALEALTVNPLVDYVEQNQKVEHCSNCEVQNNPTWGLGRISDSKDDLKAVGYALDQFLFTQDGDGTGVKCYIVDTGIRISHKEFEGRATWGFQAESSWTPTDVHGHGTHVAGTVGGSTVGVAKNCALIAVKVLSDSGSGSTAGVIAGVDFTVSDCDPSPTNKCVSNMSLGGGMSRALNDACDNAADEGVVTVVAAGNENADCALYSPASASKVITVGSAELGPNGDSLDARSWFSNWGDNIDIYAPGTGIYSCWVRSDTDYNTISGTSMASPHVAGVVAQLLSSGLPADSVQGQINSDSDKNVVNNQCDARRPAENSKCERTKNDYLQSYRGPTQDKCTRA